MTSEGPFSGLFVLDLTWILAGPYCPMLLGDLGARVVKVEPPEGANPGAMYHLSMASLPDRWAPAMGPLPLLPLWRLSTGISWSPPAPTRSSPSFARFSAPAGAPRPISTPIAIASSAGFE